MGANSLTGRNDEKNLQPREETRSNDKFIRPAVNIIETEEGLVLTADMPGASKEALDVNVEKGILTISAPARNELPGTEAYREFELASYYRQFTIPESLDHEKGSRRVCKRHPDAQGPESGGCETEKDCGAGRLKKF